MDSVFNALAALPIEQTALLVLSCGMAFVLILSTMIALWATSDDERRVAVQILQYMWVAYIVVVIVFSCFVFF